MADDPYEMMENGDVQGLREYFLRHPSELQNDKAPGFWLHHTARTGQVPVLELLVELGADVNAPLTRHDPDSPTPANCVSEAASYGHLPAVRWLVEHGAWINFENKGRKACYPLVDAATEGHAEIVMYLVAQGAWINADWGVRPVEAAINGGHREIARFLREQGAKTYLEANPPPSEAMSSAIHSHMKRHFGAGISDADLSVAAENSAIRIFRLAATDPSGFQTLYTAGASDQPIRLSNGDTTLLEFFLRLPADWPLSDDALKAPQTNWPVQSLAQIAAHAVKCGNWPAGELVWRNGDPLQPLGPGVDFCGWLILPEPGEAGLIAGDDQHAIGLAMLFPLFADEIAFQQTHGTAKLLKRFQSEGVPLFLDPHRKSVSGHA